MKLGARDRNDSETRRDGYAARHARREVGRERLFIRNNRLSCPSRFSRVERSVKECPLACTLYLVPCTLYLEPCTLSWGKIGPLGPDSFKSGDSSEGQLQI
jgi:hypothetical protein